MSAFGRNSPVLPLTENWRLGVRRIKLRDQLSDGEIRRRTGLARHTVKEWLKAPGDIKLEYQRSKADGKLTPFMAVCLSKRCARTRTEPNRQAATAGLCSRGSRPKNAGVARAPSQTSFAHGEWKASRTPAKWRSVLSRYSWRHIDDFNCLEFRFF